MVEAVSGFGRSFECSGKPRTARVVGTPLESPNRVYWKRPRYGIKNESAHRVHLSLGVRHRAKLDAALRRVTLPAACREWENAADEISRGARSLAGSVSTHRYISSFEYVWCVRVGCRDGCLGLFATEFWRAGRRRVDESTRGTTLDIVDPNRSHLKKRGGTEKERANLDFLRVQARGESRAGGDPAAHPRRGQRDDSASSID